jgi:predicted nucleic acid-binding protein
VTTAADLVLVDTNILIAATDEGRDDHPKALSVLTDWPAAGTTLYTSGQILREYLAVVTRPTDANGLGLSQPDALTNVMTFQRRLRFIPETDKTHRRLLTLLGDVPCTGKQIHDANVVATALAHGVTAIATLNLADFARFRQHIDIRAL